MRVTKHKYSAIYWQSLFSLFYCLTEEPSWAGAVDVRFDDLKHQGVDWYDNGQVKCPYIDDGFSLSFSNEFY
jgi:hypothetical protein